MKITINGFRLHKKEGFTIVELLIVIVVIAILAAISIVAYNGIQARATFTKQVAEVDRIGKAIQLWTAENGKSMGQSGSGYNGEGYGNINVATGAYPSPSLENLLRQSGYLSGPLDVNSSYMLTPCTSWTETKWVVLTIMNPTPPTTVSQQLSGTGCANWAITAYTDPNGTYKRNFAKAY